MEISEVACKYAVEKLGLEKEKIVCGDFLNASLGKKFFDLITLNDVLEHLPEPKKVLDRCFQLLKPGGGIYIQIPNFNSLGRKLFGSYWVHIDAPRHLIHFTPKMLALFLKDWRVLKITTRTNFGQVYISGYSDSLRHWLTRWKLYHSKITNEESVLIEKNTEKPIFSLQKILTFMERPIFKLLGMLSDMSAQGECLQVYAGK